jgi:hypothetical protein
MTIDDLRCAVETPTYSTRDIIQTEMENRGD